MKRSSSKPTPRKPTTELSQNGRPSTQSRSTSSKHTGSTLPVLKPPATANASGRGKSSAGLNGQTTKKPSLGPPGGRSPGKSPGTGVTSTRSPAGRSPAAGGRTPGNYGRVGMGRYGRSAGFALEPQTPTLSRERALEIAMSEMESRQEVFNEEASDRLSMIHQLVGKISVSGLEEKLGALSQSAFHAVNLLKKEEEDSRSSILAEFAVKKNLLRRIELGQVDGVQYEQLQDVEALQRKKMEYLEDRTFSDILGLEKAMRNNHNDDDRVNAIRRQNQGLHCVRLFDGCPFINPSHCPFHSMTWVDPRSLEQQHFQRKVPRLKYDKRQVERTYKQLLDRRTQRLQNIDCRLFVSRVEKGLAPTTY